MEGRSTSAGEKFLIDTYQATHILPRTLKRFTYDEMLATRGINHLGDAKLRERVSNYYIAMQTSEVTLGTVPPFREHLRQVMPYAIQQRVRSRCEEVIGEDAAGMVTATLPKSCSLGLDIARSSKGVNTVRSEPGLARDLTRYLIDLDLKLYIIRCR